MSIRDLRQGGASHALDTEFFDLRAGARFTTNPTAGQLVLAALREGLGRAGITARLRENFSVHDDDLDGDVEEFVDQLRLHGVVPPNFHLAP